MDTTNLKRFFRKIREIKNQDLLAFFKNILIFHLKNIYWKIFKTNIEKYYPEEKNSCREKIVFLVAGTSISGGSMVIYNYARLLEKNGYDVLIVNLGISHSFSWAGNYQPKIIPYQIFKNSPSLKIKCLIATHWSTADYLLDPQYQNVKKYYLVQNKEHFFYASQSRLFAKARSTYSINNVQFLTVSRWCQSWLKEEFQQKAIYIPNGIEADFFQKTNSRKRFQNPKIRILIEGNPSDKTKNIDESFKISNTLDKNKYEVWLVCYRGIAKKWYRFDKIFHSVPYTQMPAIYSDCDILLKTSQMESFSYPPLEMMASGGICIIAKNEGNKEYVVNKYNACTYKLGDIQSAIEMITKVSCDKKLRERIITNGLKTAQEKNWENTAQILIPSLEL